MEDDLCEWQQKIIDSHSIKEDRKINVIIDNNAHARIVMTKMMRKDTKGRYLMNVQSGLGVCKGVMDASPAPLYIINIRMDTKPSNLHGIWLGVTEAKDGITYNRKNGEMKIFACPQVWVLTSTIPKEEWLTKDKWVLWLLSDDGKTIKSTSFEELNK